MIELSETSINVGVACIAIVTLVKLAIPLAQMKTKIDSNSSRIKYIHDDYDNTKKDFSKQKLDVEIIKCSVERIEKAQELQTENIIKEVIKGLKE